MTPKIKHESVTKIRKEQVPSKDETTQEILYGDDDDRQQYILSASSRSNYVLD